MPEATKQPQSPLQQQILQMAQELATQLELTAQQAPPGSILDACESLLLDRGRQFLRLEEATPALLNYLCGHRDRLNYALRLRRGQPIGSGLIEGACKQMIGRRMKQTGARWDVNNANRMAFLCSLAYADSLPLYFNAA